MSLLLELNDPADGRSHILVTSGELFCNDLVRFLLFLLLDVVALRSGQFDSIVLRFDHVLQTN